MCKKHAVIVFEDSLLETWPSLKYCNSQMETKIRTRFVFLHFLHVL